MAPDMDDDMEMPSLDGTWVFAGFSAMIDGTAVTVTVGDGMSGLSDGPGLALRGGHTDRGERYPRR